MTYREKYFELKNLNNKYLNNNVIKTLLMDDGGFNDFISLLANFDKEIKDDNKLKKFIKMIENGEPYQYVLGYAYFVNSNYKVTPDVLIPRQETEQLAVSVMSMIVKLFGKDPKITIVDVGTGSGILAIYLKEYFKNSNVIAVDISEKALDVAKENAKLHNVDIDFRQGNMLDSLKNESIDVIISNPPYILDESTVAPETLKYEPHLALFANPTTKYYEEILSHMELMNDKYLIAFEIGEDMEEALTHLLESDYKGLAYKFEKDMYGKSRFLYIIRNEEIKKYDC